MMMNQTDIGKDVKLWMGDGRKHEGNVVSVEAATAVLKTDSGLVEVDVLFISSMSRRGEHGRD